MATKRLEVVIAGNAAGAKKAFGEVDAAAAGTESKLKGIGGKLKSFGSSMSTSVTLPIVAGLGLATKAAAEDEKAQALLAKALQNTGKATAGQIASVEKWITKTQNATGVMDDELRPALAKLVIAGRSVSQAQSDMGVALDIAAARGKPVASVIEAMAKAANGNVGALSKLGIATKDASGRTLTYEQILAKAAQTMGGSAAKAAETAAGKTAIFKAKMADATEAIGAGLLPILSIAADLIGKVAEWFTKLSPTMQKVVVVGALLVAAIGPLTTIITGLVAAVGFLISPVGLVIAAIAALAAGAVYAYQHFEGFRNVVDGVVKWLTDTAWPAIQQFGQNVVEGFEKVVVWVRANWPAIQEAITHVLNVIRAVVVTVVDFVSAYWEKFGERILTNVRTVWNVIYGVVKVALDLIRGVIMTVVNIINGDWGKAWDSIKATFVSVWSGIIGVVKNLGVILWNTLGGIFDGLKAIVSKGLDAVLGFFGGVKDRIATMLSGVFTAITQPFKDAWNWIANKWNSITLPEVHIPGTSITIGGGALPELPTFHNGGVYRAPRPGGEGLAILRDGEHVLTPGQSKGGITIQNVNVSTSESPQRWLDELGWRVPQMVGG